MALDNRSRGHWWSRLHFLVRFGGLTGILVGAVAAFLAWVDGVLTWEVLRRSWDLLQAQVQGQAVEEYPPLALYLLAGAVVAGLFTLLIEIIIVLRVVAGRRSAFGFNAIVQLALAAALFIGFNVYAFEHYLRFDWTWGGKFTVPADIQAQMRDLSREQGKTIIVAYRMHKSAGGTSSQNDAYESEAEAKVVEKVQDLVDQFRHLGPQFEVVVLDTKDKLEDKVKTGPTVEEPATEAPSAEAYRNKPKGFYDKFNPLPAPLKKAIEEAPENSIFFYARDKVQRLSFDDLYQLDKIASIRDGNLVLLNQGVAPFARQILNIDQKRPKVGILTIHEYLTTKGPDELGLNGVKKALTEHGFDVEDIILKRDNRMTRDLEPAVYTFEEYQFEKFDTQLASIDEDIKRIETAVTALTKLIKRVQDAKLEELTDPDGKPATERDRQAYIKLQRQRIDAWQQDILDLQEERASIVKDKGGLNSERVSEELRMRDLKAKLTRKLADCDLVIVPRLTVMDLSTGWAYPTRLFRLDKAQTDAIRDYVKSGKPLLACFGPESEPAERGAPRQPSEPDGLEQLLTELGVQFDTNTVVFDAEAKKFDELRSGQLVAGGAAVVPPVVFDWAPDAFRRPDSKIVVETREHPINPIRRSMRIATRGAGDNLDLPPHHPRPITLDPKRAEKLAFDPVFMATNRKSWSEDKPFPSRDSTPRYQEAKQRGPIPIGVAFETPIPESWYTSKKATPATVRLAVIGDGRMFVAHDLSAAKERLLLTTCNWLLGRDDLLARDDQLWSYPRVALTPREHEVWKWGALIGLPALFAYLGLVVLLVRRLR